MLCILVYKKKIIKIIDIEVMTIRVKKCPTCGKGSSVWEEADKYPIFKKMETVLKSHKSPYEKKIALFNCLKNMEIGELQPIEKERIDFLLQSKLHGELAKQSLKQYEKLTVEDYSKRQ